MQRIDGQLVVITGVGRKGQVGETVARMFGERGAALVLISRDGAPDRAAELRTLGMAATGHDCDLADPDALQRVSQATAEAHPAGVAALICLAGGFAPFGRVADSTPGTWQHLATINATTAYLTTRAFLPQLRQARGAILYFASAAVMPGATVAEMSGYAAAKAGVVTLMRAVASEEAGHGVRANALAPTAINTRANQDSMGTSSAYVERETIGEWATFLCSSASGPVTGQLIQVG
ncbi:MAG: SDR family oxidoreductase [Gemmatimonadaceae bacterium]